MDLTVVPRVAPIEPDEVVLPEDRRAEAFLLYAAGWTQKAIAERFGVSAMTISKDLGKEARARRSRAQNVEFELERICGVVEHVMVKALDRHNEAADAKIQSLAGSNYLRLVLDAAAKLAQLRGLESDRPAPRGDGKSRVVVTIGGSREEPQIAVGVESD